MKKLTARGLKHAAPLAIAALFLTACSDDGYDEPTNEYSVSMGTDLYNEEARSNGDPTINMETFEQRSKNACDLLPDQPTYDDYVDLSRDLEETLDIHYTTATALVTQGTGTWCRDKFESAFPETSSDE